MGSDARAVEDAPQSVGFFRQTISAAEHMKLIHFFTGTRFARFCFGRWPMTTGFKRHVTFAIFGLLLLALGASSCGTLAGATVGGAAGAGVGAATHSNVRKDAAIGAGVGGAAGALYDIFGCCRY